VVRKIELLLAAALLLGLFSSEIADPDFWWHLRTGQFVVEHRALPVPDPFAFTTGRAVDTYATERITRNFNLTHEWLAQAALYLVYRMGGFPGVVLWRAAMLTAFCALVGWLAYRRSGGYYRGLAATFAAAGVAVGFASDRPYLFTFVLLAATVAILEIRRGLWLLPPLFVIWANCHGGFFLGWVALACYAAEGWVNRRDRRLLLVSAVCVLVSGLNPNGFRVLPVLLDYRRSFLQSRLLEWVAPTLWPPQWFGVLLVGAGGVLVWARQRVRIADWLLFAAFAAAALTAERNTILIGFLAPILVAAYVPWKRPTFAFARFAVPALLVAGLAVGAARGDFFQLRAAEWRYPKGAADFLLAHGIRQPMFNTYEFGGYLMWRLWPLERVFIDGRALSESVFMDYARILYNHDESDGQKSAQQLLDDYGVQAIVMNTFQYSNGLVYLLAPSLADPAQKDWKLVYDDPQALVFLRQPPPGVEAMDSLRVLEHMEQECDLHIEKEPQYPRCARGLGQVFSKVGDYARARRWLGVYLSHSHGRDPEAEQAYAQMSGIR
jgi:hypothetical protein